MAGTHRHGLTRTTLLRWTKRRTLLALTSDARISGGLAGFGGGVEVGGGGRGDAEGGEGGSAGGGG